MPWGEFGTICAQVFLMSIVAGLSVGVFLSIVSKK